MKRQPLVAARLLPSTLGHAGKWKQIKGAQERWETGEGSARPSSVGVATLVKHCLARGRAPACC